MNEQLTEFHPPVFWTKKLFIGVLLSQVFSEFDDENYLEKFDILLLWYNYSLLVMLCIWIISVFICFLGTH